MGYMINHISLAEMHTNFESFIECYIIIFYILESNIREGANDYSEKSGSTASSSLNVLKTLVSVTVLIKLF